MDEKTRLKFASTMSRIIADVCSGKMNPPAAAARLRAGADWLEAKDNGKTKSREENKELNEAARRVFDFWQRETKSPQSKFETWKDLIKRRLKKYTEKQLCTIVTWAVRDEFRGGKYDGIDNLFRSDARVDEYIRKAARDGITSPVGTTGNATGSAHLEDLRRRSVEAARAGRVEEYEKIEKEIADVTRRGEETTSNESGTGSEGGTRGSGADRPES